MATCHGLARGAMMLLTAVLAVAWMDVVPAQTPAGAFRSGVQLVEVYATVTDGGGRPITDLRQEDFEVYEDGERQSIDVFSAGEFPLTVALGVDRSWSMAGGPLRTASEAAQSFLRALGPQDRSMVVGISSEAEVLAPLSVERAVQLDVLRRLDPWSTTALRDAMIAMLDRLTDEPGRRAVVVFSDGADRYSRASENEVYDAARRSGSLIYPIVIGRRAIPWMDRLADASGGRAFVIRDTRRLAGTLALIAAELRHQYLIGYAPKVEPEVSRGVWHRLRVSVPTRRGAQVRARDGYTSG